MPSDFVLDDPVYLHTRREAWLILLVWLASLLWVIPYCAFNAYEPANSVDGLKLVGGVPAWVFWGVLAPWFVTSLVTFFFCQFVIRDDELSDEPLTTSSSAGETA
jgi:hypothetical protein